MAVPPSTSRIFVSFDAYQLGSWDGNHLEFGTDSFGTQFVGERDGRIATVDFGHYNQNDAENTITTGSANGFSWSIVSSSIQGGDGSKRLGVTVSIPSHYFSDKGDNVIMTLTWNFSGIKDEFIGFDNFLAVACIDLVPSTAPSETPSSSLSLAPTREPPRPRPAPTVIAA
jgi:hypothetical protein